MKNPYIAVARPNTFLRSCNKPLKIREHSRSTREFRSGFLQKGLLHLWFPFIVLKKLQSEK